MTNIQNSEKTGQQNDGNLNKIKLSYFRNKGLKLNKVWSFSGISKEVSGGKGKQFVILCSLRYAISRPSLYIVIYHKIKHYHRWNWLLEEEL